MVVDDYLSFLPNNKERIKKIYGYESNDNYISPIGGCLLAGCLSAKSSLSYIIFKIIKKNEAEQKMENGRLNCIF